MTSLPQPYQHRPTRVRPAEFTPAVLRIQDGTCTPGELELFSLTGGLLSLPKPLDHGSRVKVVFLTATGPVLGEAEMLHPVSWTEQPFRFVSLHEKDQRRLHAATRPAIKRNITTSEGAPLTLEAQALPSKDLSAQDREQQWIEKYREAIARSEAPSRRLPKIVLATLTLASIALGALYIFQAQLLRFAGSVPSVFSH
jgi:hypothetical protein